MHRLARVIRPARVLALVVALTALLLGAPAASAAPAPSDAEPPETPLVLAGVSGLQWSDVDAVRTPHLWRLIGGGSVASIAVRTLTPTCPVEGWLTLSAGSRAVAQPAVPDGAEDSGEDTAQDSVDGAPALGCPTVPVPPTTDDGTERAHVPGWTELAASDPLTPNAAEPGALGEVADVAGTCTTAVGPGAAVALADAGGDVPRYLSDAGRLTAAQVAECPATVVDLGVLPDAASERTAAVEELDDQVGRLADLLPAGGRLVVAGISDTPLGPSDLQVVVDWTAPGGRATWLSSTSSRWAGVVVLADLSATVADTVTGGALSGTSPTDEEAATDDGSDGDDGSGTTADDGEDTLDQALAPFTGSPLERGDDRRISVSRTVENRQYLSVLTDTVPRLSPLVLGLVGLADIVVVGALLLARRRGARDDGGADDGRPRYGRRVGLAVLVVASSLPVAASLATLSRWWAAPSPVTTLVLSLTVAALVAALVAWFARRLLPPSPWRLATSLAGVTWLVVTVDGLTGTTLQQGSLLGPAPSLGARFYGFSNTVFAVYAVVGLVLAAGLAAAVRARGGSPARAGWTAAAVGLVTVLVDGLPPFGADFGGILALVPGFAVLALGVAGVRITGRRMLLVAAGTVLVVAVVSVVDWLLPGPGSHLGGFVESVVEGRALGVVAGKAAGAWATVANPAGAAALLVCVAAAWAVLAPGRARLDGLARAYRQDPVLWRLVVALVVTAGVGTLLNDSGVAVAAIVLALAVPVLLAGRLAHAEEAVTAPRSGAARAAGPVLARVPAVLVGASAGLLVALLVGTTALPGSASARAGDVSSAGTPVVDDAHPVVIVGTQGLRWEDVSPSATPTLWDVLRDGASGAGVTPAVGGASATCPAAGWLGLSSGRSPVTGQTADGAWSCAPWEVTAPSGDASGDGAATVDGWDDLAALQSSSEFRPTLGVLGDALADGGVCTTAVAPGAALALADRDGAVARYRTLDAALADPADTFSCPVTVVDAGSAPYHPDPEGYTGLAPLPDDVTADGPARDTALRAVDATVGRVLATAPADATVLVMDVGNPAPGRPSLGVGVADADADDAPAYLTSGATHWLGVVRLLDVPTTLVSAFDVPVPADLSGSPIELAAERPGGTGATVRELAGLTERDHMLRVTTGTVTTLPAYVGLAAFALVVLLLPRLRRTSPRAAGRWARVLDAVLLVCASVPAAAFLMTAWGWWRLAEPATALWLTLGASTVVVALVGALAPRRPVWAGATVVATLTFLVLTVDAMLGTPLHRGSPLGSAPTLGGRYYGFGNPTYSIYATAAVIAAAGLATAVRRRWGTIPAGVVAAAVGLVTLVVSVWPTLGADVGGGLVLVPVFVVVVLGVLEARVTWKRLILAGLAGVALVAVIGVVDWLRPAAQRTHLGAFVQSVVDGTAIETVARKAGYALRSLTGGVPAWLALAVLVGLVAVLWGGPRLRARWLERSEARWPLLRPVLVSLLLAGVGGAVVNDYGIRMVSIMLSAAVPLVGLIVLRTGMTEDPDDRGQPAAEELLPASSEAAVSSGVTSPEAASPEVAERAERPGT
ncbi:hypothetical protein SAMN04324258_1645 [Krasilnikoviella flava]|uniref:Uncharacterized protein n=1 Tax=Krasilnikoviella flava TaxID=526729 RepID=A0A1T5JY79_9MICO|nr:hypothetical protein SAMN04324258_1645 [Krasilnikoviella flava]